MMKDATREQLEDEYQMPVGRLMYHLYVECEMSAGDISEELDKPRQTVKDWLQESGIKMRSRTLSDVQRILIMSYIDAGMGDKAIGSRVGCSWQTVRRYRKDIEASGEPVDLNGWVSRSEYETLCSVVEHITDE